MKTVFLTSFLRDVKKLRDAKVRASRCGRDRRGRRSSYPKLEQVSSLKRLSGQRDYFRIRIGDWRIGLLIHSDTITFVRCLNRREMDRFFP